MPSDYGAASKRVPEVDAVLIHEVNPVPEQEVGIPLDHPLRMVEGGLEERESLHDNATGMSLSRRSTPCYVFTPSDNGKSPKPLRLNSKRLQHNMSNISNVSGKSAMSPLAPHRLSQMSTATEKSENHAGRRQFVTSIRETLCRQAVEEQALEDKNENTTLENDSPIQVVEDQEKQIQENERREKHRENERREEPALEKKRDSQKGLLRKQGSSFATPVRKKRNSVTFVLDDAVSMPLCSTTTASMGTQASTKLGSTVEPSTQKAMPSTARSTPVASASLLMQTKSTSLVNTCEKLADSAEKRSNTSENLMDSSEKLANSSTKTASNAEKLADGAETLQDSREKLADSSKKLPDSSEKHLNSTKRLLDSGEKTFEIPSEETPAESRPVEFRPEGTPNLKESSSAPNSEAAQISEKRTSSDKPKTKKGTRNLSKIVYDVESLAPMESVSSTGTTNTSQVPYSRDQSATENHSGSAHSHSTPNNFGSSSPTSEAEHSRLEATHLFSEESVSGTNRNGPDFNFLESMDDPARLDVRLKYVGFSNLGVGVSASQMVFVDASFAEPAWGRTNSGDRKVAFKFDSPTKKRCLNRNASEAPQPTKPLHTPSPIAGTSKGHLSNSHSKFIPNGRQVVGARFIAGFFVVFPMFCGYAALFGLQHEVKRRLMIPDDSSTASHDFGLATSMLFTGNFMFRFGHSFLPGSSRQKVFFAMGSMALSMLVLIFLVQQYTRTGLDLIIDNSCLHYNMHPDDHNPYDHSVYTTTDPKLQLQNSADFSRDGGAIPTDSRSFDTENNAMEEYHHVIEHPAGCWICLVVAYALGGIGIGTFESNFLATITPLEKIAPGTKQTAITAIPCGIGVSLIGGFALLSFNFSVHVLYVFVVLNCICGATVYSARIPDMMRYGMEGPPVNHAQQFTDGRERDSVKDIVVPIINIHDTEETFSTDIKATSSSKTQQEIPGLHNYSFSKLVSDLKNWRVWLTKPQRKKRLLARNSSAASIISEAGPWATPMLVADLASSSMEEDTHDSTHRNGLSSGHGAGLSGEGLLTSNNGLESSKVAAAPTLSVPNPNSDGGNTESLLQKHDKKYDKRRKKPGSFSLEGRSLLSIIWVFAIDMFCLATFCPGVIPFIYDSRQVVVLHHRISTDTFFAIYNAWNLLGGICGRWLSYSVKNPRHPMLFLSMSIVGVTLTIIKHPLLAPLGTFIIMLGDGLIYGTMCRFIDQNLCRTYNLVAISLWLTFGDLGSVVGANAIPYFRDWLGSYHPPPPEVVAQWDSYWLPAESP